MHTIALVLLLGALELSPIPQSVNLDGREVLRLTPTTPVIVADDAGDDIRIGLRRLFDTIGYELPVYYAAGFRPGDFGIYIGTAGKHVSFDHRRMRRRVRSDDLVQPESYRINIWRNGAVVAGADDAGTWYGLQALHDIVEQAPLQWPALEILDAPDLPLRGIVVRRLPSASELEGIAAARCNLIVFDSPDFADLTGARADAWKEVFERARMLHMEPVPMLPVVDRAGALLQKAPLAVEALSRREEVTLRSDDWVALRERNVLVTAETPVHVSVSNVRLEERVDYMLDFEPLRHPYPELTHPFMIRRIPGGGIPNGATVSVRYHYAPPGSAALCPYAPETEALLEETIRNLVAVLDPTFVHLDYASAQRAGQDARCRHEAGENPAGAALTRMLRLVDGLLREEKAQARLMIWDDLLHPDKAAAYGLESGDINVPGQTMVIARAIAPEQLQRDALLATRRNLERLNRSFLLHPALDTPQAQYGVATLFSAERPEYRGMLLAGPRDALGFQVGMEKAWSRQRSVYVWPERLNAHLRADLWRPAFEERLHAVVEHYNRNSLDGIAPTAVHEGIQTTLRLSGGLEYDDAAEAEQVRLLSENIANYLGLESEFQRSGDTGLLRRLASIVEQQTRLDPMMDQDREDRILQNVETQGLFVPASILFGEQLLYYRRQNLPSDWQLLEIPVQPTFQDAQGRVNAVIDLMTAVAPVARIDFETVGAERLRLSAGNSRDALQTVQEWSREGAMMLRGPALLSQAQAARYLDLQVEAAAEQAVLRELRLFALKAAARTTVPETADFSPRRAVPMAELVWPREAQVNGFVNARAARFAETPTEVRLLWNQSHLLMRVDAFEPRMHTLVSDFTERDAPLWEQESVEIHLAPDARHRYRFVVNPGGVQFDSLNSDSGWRGAWDVQTRRADQGWIAYVRIPFQELDAWPQRGDVWSVNVLRNRHNVVQEQSVWAWQSDHAHIPIFMGAIQFD